MKSSLLLPRTKVVLAVLALGACSNLQQQASNDQSKDKSKDISHRLQAQTELQSTIKQRLKQLEDGAQVMKDEYLQQVSQSGATSTYQTVTATQSGGTTMTPATHDAASILAAKDVQSQVFQHSTPGKLKPGPESRSSQPMPAALAANIEMPKADHPGQCFARTFVPPRYQEVKEKFLVKEATERVEIVAARYETEEQQVLISEASETLEVIPATYKLVEERVLVKPSTATVVEVPATYKHEARTVLVQPEHSVWKQQLSETNGEIMSLVKVAAIYKTVPVLVIDQPATTKEIQLPAQYKIVKKRVVDKPASTRTVKIAAKYKTMMVEKQIEPPKSDRVSVSAEYSTLTKTQKVKDGYLAWREVLCDDRVTPQVVSQIQKALKKEGFNPGPVDGFIGHRTMQAINRYQRNKALPVDQYFNLSTLKALGVDLP